MPVTLNGKPLAQPGFLDGAEHVVEWQGLRLRVFRGDGPKVLDLFDRHQSWDRRLYLNFHGHVVECGDAVALAEVNGLARSVFVDVISAPDLRLVLPARNEAIDNDFFRAMRARAERALLEAVALRPKHSLAFGNAGRAERLGIALPPVEIALTPWQLASDEPRSRLDAPAPVVLGTPGPEVLLDGGIGLGDGCEQVNLHHLLLGWQGAVRVVEANEHFAGYPAYDALRSITEVSAAATGADGATEELRRPDEDDGPASLTDERRVVETLNARLMVKEGGRSRGEPVVLHEAPVPFFSTSEAFGDEFPGLAVVRGTNPGDLADALVEGFFSDSHDAGADSYEHQLEFFPAEARDLARRLPLDNDAAVVARIVEELCEIRWVLRTLGTGSIELRIDQGQDGSTIRIVTSEDKEVTSIL
ncbi:hypothetical protein [Roseomonas gilardii]|uniref:hypothetical protein n=1 Tax=Roseomonas gilardii TaxID=257708 RepID=UPI0011A0E5BC|nr:hypothetical protein [Roseomonas gilardii]